MEDGAVGGTMFSLAGIPPVEPSPKAPTFSLSAEEVVIADAVVVAAAELVGSTMLSLAGIPPVEPCSKAWLDVSDRVEDEAVGGTMSSLAGMPLEGRSPKFWPKPPLCLEDS